MSEEKNIGEVCNNKKIGIDLKGVQSSKYLLNEISHFNHSNIDNNEDNIDDTDTTNVINNVYTKDPNPSV